MQRARHSESDGAGHDGPIADPGRMAPKDACGNTSPLLWWQKGRGGELHQQPAKVGKALKGTAMPLRRERRAPYTCVYACVSLVYRLRTKQVYRKRMGRATGARRGVPSEFGGPSILACH